MLTFLFIGIALFVGALIGWLFAAREYGKDIARVREDRERYKNLLIDFENRVEDYLDDETLQAIYRKTPV